MRVTTKERQLFESLCEELPATEGAELAAAVSAHVAELREAQGRSEFIAVDLALLVQERLLGLLGTMGELQPAQRSLVVGAARYFVSNGDAIPDERACTGLDDDVRIVNHVLKELGRIEWLIEE